MNRWNYTQSNPVNYTDPSGHCIFTGIDTVACLVALVVGIPIIAGVATSAYNYAITQGGAIGGHNANSRRDCIDFSQVLLAGEGATLCALSSEGEMLSSLILFPTYILAYLAYGESPAEVNMNILSGFGLDDEYQAAMSNPNFEAGKIGGQAGMTYISLASFFKGLPSFRAGSTSFYVPTDQNNGTLAYTVLTLPGIEVVGGSGELLYIGTAGFASQIATINGSSGGNGEGSSGLINGSKMSEEEILDAAKEFLGPGYKDMGDGRFVSANGLRQFRIGESDLLGIHGGGPHANFEILAPNPAKPGRFIVIENIHIYIRR